MSSGVTLAERAKAAGTHLLLSAVMLGVALYLVFVLWYPSPLQEAVGVGKVYLMMLMIDVLLGPMLTFMVFKKHRIKLIFDLTVIVVLQLSAYFYGLHVVSAGRPVWLVFVIDDFELVRPADIDYREQQAFAPQYRVKLFSSPRWVAAVYSDDPQVREEQREDEMFNGISLATRPEAYVPLDSRRQQISARAQPLDRLSRFNDPQAVAAALVRYPDAVGWLPLKGEEKDLVVLVDAAGNVLSAVDLAPWS